MVQKQISAVENIRIRPANEFDAAELASLLGELGYPTEATVVKKRLHELTLAGDSVLVALDSAKAIGMILLHRTYFLHRPPDGRISTLVVNKTYRSQRIGARLVEAAEAVFKDWGCERVEVSSGTQREAAHRFYVRCGYSEQPKRFIKTLK